MNVPHAGDPNLDLQEIFTLILELFYIYRCHHRDRFEFFEAVSCTRSAFDCVFGRALGVVQRVLDVRRGMGQRVDRPSLP